MAVLRRKGGGLPPNYQEVHFWLGRMQAPAKEQKAARAEERVAPVAKAVAVTEPVAAKKAEVPVSDGKSEVAAGRTQMVSAPPVAVEEPVMVAEPETAPVEAPAAEKAGESANGAAKDAETAAVAELPKRAGTMLGLDLDGEIPKEITEEDAKAKAGEAEDEDAGTLNRKRRGFLGFGRRKSRA